MTVALGPRVVIAGTHSGVGKTTIATGLMAAIRAAGTSVASAKVGPDFIDPGYHSLATGRPPRNLDAWICGPDAIAPLAARAAAGGAGGAGGDGGEILIVEGVMGLYDGAVDSAPSSTADVAKLLDAPVILVVDGSAMSSSIAALVRGYRDHDPGIRLAGVILNRVSHDRHRQLLVEALAAIDVAVLGCVGTDDALTWRDRHLGLIPVDERPTEIAEQLARLAAVIADACDLDAIVRVARSAPRLHADSPPAARHVAPVRIALASGAAFSFMYRDNVEALEAAGAEIVEFDPLVAERLPSDVDGLVVGGGFPEVFALRLADNAELLADVRTRIEGGLVTWAECGGLLWLSNSLDERPLVGAIDAVGTMTERLTLGYRTVTAQADNPLIAAGETVRGHEFHYSRVEPGGDALRLDSRFGSRDEGFATPSMLATYMHQHLGGDPSPAERFVRAAVRARSDRSDR